MLMTDMDKDDPQDRNKVTLMTVHSAKGLEYKYVYIVGLEENLFPSQRAVESPDGIEEERRLFYVALTRAKERRLRSPTPKCVSSGATWSSRVRAAFCARSTSRYIESDADFAETRPQRRPGDDGPAAIDELRRRFDYRFQQKRQGGGRFGGGGNGGSGGSAEGSFGRGGGFGGARRRRAVPRVVSRGLRSPGVRRRLPIRRWCRRRGPSTDGMRRVGVRQAMDGGPSVRRRRERRVCRGQRVEHPKFGVGIVQRIETLSTDHKLVVAFDNAGEKTLLAKFAKLTKL